MREVDAVRTNVRAPTDVSLAKGGRPTLDALVFIMLRCLRAFEPYSDENTVLGEVLSLEGEPSSAELWRQSVEWGVREQGYEIQWPEGEGWLEGSVRYLAQKLYVIAGKEKAIDTRSADVNYEISSKKGIGS